MAKRPPRHASPRSHRLPWSGPGRSVLIGAIAAGAATVITAAALWSSDGGSSTTAGAPTSAVASQHTRDATANVSISPSGSSSQPTTAAPGIPRLPIRPRGQRGPAHGAPSEDAPAIPVQLDIPTIGVHTTLEQLTRLADGTLQPPTQWDQAGWYSGGPRPGDIGPAVIAGHIDSTTGPAVFYRLRDLVPRDAVSVTDAAGEVHRFVVDRVRAFAKSDFPAADLYGPTPVPELRLITCTGTFDQTTHNYLDNLVVYAHVVSSG